MTWVAFVEWQRSPRRTSETAAEYAAMTKAERDKAKAGAAYVAGYLTGGKRSKATIKRRSMLTLDADTATAELWEDYCLLVGATALLYSTHSYTEGKPKYRLVLPLSRDVAPDEYQALAMKVAECVGLAYFDATGFQPERLMYKSSCSADADFIFKTLDSEPLDVDRYLALYPDWRDTSCWPVTSVMPSGADAPKVQDPTEKPGVIGAFCRLYDVPAAIEAFLPNTYTEAGEGRYTYADGSAWGGLVVYEDGKLAFSYHATDPAATGRACNAFDLVRLHKWGELDVEAREGTPVNKLPSVAAALDFALALEGVGAEVARERLAEATDDFTDTAADETEGAEDDLWLSKLAKNRKGDILPTADNIGLVFRYDRGLKGKIRRDTMAGQLCVVAKTLPWRRIEGGTSRWSDGDDAELRIYFESRYGIVNKSKIDDAVSHEADSRPYDPLREYLEGLPPWDGTARLDTLFIDLMGAEDSAYTRAITRKTFCAAVARALYPGCKFDYMLILEGEQGLGKSSVFQLLAGRWFTDSLSLTDLSRDKVAAEKLQGSWICEVAELAGMAKADIERLKGFLTTTHDKYRAAYDRRVDIRPRRGIIVGSVNNLEGYLRDATGNRRFWPLRVHTQLDRRRLSAATVAQVWAEAKSLIAAGEPLYLDADIEQAAKAKQREAMEIDPRESLVQMYLETPVPEGFASYSLDERMQHWVTRGDFGDAATEGAEGVTKRSEVSIIEIWTEALREPTTRPNRYDSYQIGAILKRLGWEATGKAARLKAYGVVKTYENTL
jgi:predicted P-loop ATPase